MLFPPGKLTKRYGFPWKWSLNSGLVMTLYDFLWLFHISISCRAYPDSGHHFSQLLVPAARSGRGTCLQRRLWAKTGCRSQNGRGPKSSPWVPANMDVVWCNMMQQAWNPTISVRNVETCWDMLRYSLKGTQRYLKMRTAWPSSPTLFCVVFRPARSFPRETSKGGQHRIWDILRTEISSPYLKKLASRTMYGREADVLVLFCFYSAAFHVIWVCHNSVCSTTAWTPWFIVFFCTLEMITVWVPPWKIGCNSVPPKLPFLYGTWWLTCGLILRVPYVQTRPNAGVFEVTPRHWRDVWDNCANAFVMIGVEYFTTCVAVSVVHPQAKLLLPKKSSKFQIMASNRASERLFIETFLRSNPNRIRSFVSQPKNLPSPGSSEMGGDPPRLLGSHRWKGPKSTVPGSETLGPIRNTGCKKRLRVKQGVDLAGPTTNDPWGCCGEKEPSTFSLVALVICISEVAEILINPEHLPWHHPILSDLWQGPCPSLCQSIVPKPHNLRG
jgi:hypothetical protein